MQQRKIFPIVASGFRTKVKKALVSKPYPYNIPFEENIEVSAVEILSGEMRVVLFEEEFDDMIEATATIILSGELTTTVIEIADPSEEIYVSATNILSGEYRTVVVNNDAPEEQVTVSATIILSGTLA